MKCHAIANSTEKFNGRRLYSILKPCYTRVVLAKYAAHVTSAALGAVTGIDVFQELGVKATHGEPGRDDVIVEFDGMHAVIEVKGKKGSAAESDAAQLEKWVAGFKEEKGADPKGILLVNAYCETPLAERTEPAFPHQMLKYSTQREHCLMTTTQLLGLLLEARAHSERRVDLVNSLFSTVSVYPQFADWRTFLIAPAPAVPEKTT